MFVLKGCPRCSGDLYQDRDIYGEYLACLQCGHYLPDGEIGEIVSALEVQWFEEKAPAELAIVA